MTQLATAAAPILQAAQLAAENGPALLAIDGRCGSGKSTLAEFLAGRVQAFLEAETGHAYDILLIETPPQHGKSMTVTESVPSWYLGKHPEARIIMASYNEGFAERFLRRCFRRSSCSLPWA